MVRTVPNRYLFIFADSLLTAIFADYDCFALSAALSLSMVEVCHT